MNDSKDTEKREGISISLRAGLAFVLAILMSILLMLSYNSNVNLYINPYIFLFLLIPTITYILGIIINVGIQSIACGKIDIVKIATSNLFNFAIPLTTLLLVSFIPFFKAIIDSAFPLTYDYNYKSQLSTTFYLFWSILYSQVFTSGFITIC